MLRGDTTRGSREGERENLPPRRSELNSNSELLATEIAKAMKKREADLLDKGLLLAEVCLDVNSMEMLPLDSAEKAIQTITSLALRIQGLDEDDSKQIITDDDNDNAMSSSSED